MYLKSRDAMGNRKCMRCGGVLDEQLRCRWQGCDNSAQGIDRSRRLALAHAHAEQMLQLAGPSLEPAMKRTVLAFLDTAFERALCADWRIRKAGPGVSMYRSRFEGE
jgi:hypothetical protein